MTALDLRLTQPKACVPHCVRGIRGAFSPADGHVHTTDELSLHTTCLHMPTFTRRLGNCIVDAVRDGNARGPYRPGLLSLFLCKGGFFLFFLGALDGGLARPPLERNLGFRCVWDWNVSGLGCWAWAERFQFTILGWVWLAGC